MCNEELTRIIALLDPYFYQLDQLEKDLDLIMFGNTNDASNYQKGKRPITFKIINLDQLLSENTLKCRRLLKSLADVSSKTNTLFLLVNNHIKIVRDLEKRGHFYRKDNDEWLNSKQYACVFEPERLEAEKYRVYPRDGFIAIPLSRPKLNLETNEFEVKVLRRFKRKPETVNIRGVALMLDSFLKKFGPFNLSWYDYQKIMIENQLKEVIRDKNKFLELNRH